MQDKFATLVSMKERACFLVLCALILQGVLPAPPLVAQTPDGYRSYENEEHGLSWAVHKYFEPIPIPPNEKQILARYVKGTSKRQRERGLVVLGRPQILVVTLGNFTPKGEENAGPDPLLHLEREAIKRLHQFFLRRKERVFLKEVDRKEDGKDFPLRIFFEAYGKDPDKVDEKSKESPKPRGLLRLFLDPEEIVLMAGFCNPEEHKNNRSHFTKAAKTLTRRKRTADRSTDARKKIESYIRKGYKQPEYRANVEAALVRGWKVIHTKDYIVIHHTQDRRILERIQRYLEAIRSEYERLFPPARPIQEVSTVRLCKDRNEYLAFGGDHLSRTAGFWNASTKELVLYDADKGKQGSRFGNRDTVIVLFHEAFHQYIYYAAGRLAPHTWFNEGFADYFSGAKIIQGKAKVGSIGLHPWRVNLIRKLVEDSESTNKTLYMPLKKMIKASKIEYYMNGSKSYAQGWSFIHFLQQGRALKKNPEWKEILPTYYDTLKRIYEEGLASLEGEGEKPGGKKLFDAQENARKAALEAAFKGVNLLLLEQEWKNHVRSLPKINFR